MMDCVYHVSYSAITAVVISSAETVVWTAYAIMSIRFLASSGEDYSIISSIIRTSVKSKRLL